MFDSSLNFAQLTARGGHICDLTIKQNLTKTDIVWCAHHVSLAALIALPTWQLSGIAKWKFISLSLLFFSSPRDQSWHCIPLNYSGVDDADIYVMMTQDGATYTVASFAMNCPKIIMPTINVCDAEKPTKCSSVLLLRLVGFSAWQTLHNAFHRYSEWSKLLSCWKFHKAFSVDHGPWTPNEAFFCDMYAKLLGSWVDKLGR